MMGNLLKFNNDNNSVTELLNCVRQGIPSAAFGVTDSFKNYIVSVMPARVLFLVKDELTAMQSLREISQFSNKKVVYIPPKDEVLLNMKAFSKDMSYKRIEALSNLGSASVIIATPKTLLQTIPKQICKLKIEKGEEILLSAVVNDLLDMGYERKEQCVFKGCFSLRGDLLDVFPINRENPLRIDFFGDTVESIREFDVETFKTIKFLDNAELIQTVEFLITEQDFENAKAEILKEIKRTEGNAKLRKKLLADDVFTAMETKDADALCSLAPLTEKFAFLTETLQKDTVVVYSEGKQIHEICVLEEKEFSERFHSLCSAGEVFAFAEKNFMGLERLLASVKKFTQAGLQTLALINPFFNPLKIINPVVSGIANYQSAFSEVYTDIDNWLKGKYRVLVCATDLKKAERFCLDLSDKGIPSVINGADNFNGVNIVTRLLDRGFVFHEDKLVVIGSGNLFIKPKEKKLKANKKQGFFNAPEIGDYCVHEVHGVGKVLGNKKITTSEGTKDYVCVEYFGGDLLYIPVEQMDILTRYLGGEKHPKLSKIGGKDFERIKKSVKESIKKMSFDLKRLYKQRQEEQGFKFVNEPELQDYFENSFPYELTEDQQKACEEIERDMTSHTVMDRLVCGDVGYGKTEVAFRAVFRAVSNGKQVAMVAPTTILTEQHYNTALNRFKDFGISIACLNRFKTPKQQNEILKGLKEGKIDFVIGTHRLFSKDVIFKDLGLLVLDEEQRFGVEHKEKIKLIKKNVDTLTLTATPIPRTLHMSLSGIRSISTISTPPKKRLPVQTYVTEQTDMLIKDAVSREVNRGGQVFILYNRVESINAFATHVQSLMPNLKITVAHGQMEERKLEKSILSFYKGESDALISTTIIENGIDLPKANTLIVIDADLLGLSTLYQIKGRVGRSDRLAYAYFTFKRDKILTSTAFDRLNAIVEFAEMGSGIKIAMRDLEIRGAGNILGAEQHGHMDKIGYELYSKLLKEELSGNEEVLPDLDIRVTAYIPEDYIENPTVRMDIYKAIAEIRSVKDEEELVNSLEEAYGDLPVQILNLTEIAIVKRMASKLKVKKITVTGEEVSLSFENFNSLNSQKLLTAADCFGRRVKISATSYPKIEFAKDYNDNAKMLGNVKEFLILATE